MPQNTVNQQSTGDIDVEQLDAYAARVLATGMCPAVAVAVCDRERTLVARTYGAAPSDALWPIASIGKSCTAVIALQLAEEGLLDLHAPVSAYVSWLSLGGARAPVTMHHLLTHTAGLVESSDLAPASTYDVIALASLQDGPAAGERRLYSNVGYRAAGVVLEAVGGRPYGELVQARVLDRIGLRHAAAVMVHDTRRRLPGGHVPFYDDRPWRGEHGLAPAPWVESAEADGCQCMSLEDLAAYLQALWAGSALLASSSLELMKTAQPPHDEEWAHGYGLDVHGDGFGHAGDMLGYVSFMRADTAAGVGVVAFANGLAGARAMGEAARAIAAGRAPVAPELEVEAPLVDDGSCPAEWAAYPGRYRSHNPWLPTFVVGARRGALVMGSDWMDGSRRRPLTAIRGGLFRIDEQAWSPERLSFDTVLDGRAQRAWLNGMAYYRAFTG